MKVQTLIVLLVAATFSCEAYPYIVTRVVLPPGVRGTKENLHLESSSERQQSDPKPELSKSGFSEVHEETDGFTIVFGTAIGGQTFTYARVWLDVNGNGLLDSGDAAGDLQSAPFRALDQGMFGCSSNRNTAPNIVMARVP